MKRRTFVAAAAAAPVLLHAADKKWKVGVIGHSGRGNYGHGLDKVWLDLPETEIVAVADPDEKGLAGAGKKLGIDAGFTDYRKMLAETKPDIVAVSPRHPDQHADMILASIEAGVKGIYVEKPFVRTLKEVDAIREAAGKTGTKIAIAHRNRYHPDLIAIDQILNNEGNQKIGKILEIRGRGKGDRRGGAEDLWVLGTHVLNLVARFGGKPTSCSATMLKEGKLVEKSDIYPGKEALGPLAGDEIHARYVMDSGLVAYFDSMANDETKNKGFGLQIFGSEGTVIIHCDAKPLAHYRRGNPLDPSFRGGWEVVGNTDPEAISTVHNHILPCRDLLAAIEEDREPICGLEEGAMTLEMVMAVFASHMKGGKAVEIPLQDRTHPLG